MQKKTSFLKKDGISNECYVIYEHLLHVEMILFLRYVFETSEICL